MKKNCFLFSFVLMNIAIHFPISYQISLFLFAFTCNFYHTQQKTTRRNNIDGMRASKEEKKIIEIK